MEPFLEARARADLGAQKWRTNCLHTQTDQDAICIAQIADDPPGRFRLLSDESGQCEKLFRGRSLRAFRNINHTEAVISGKMFFADADKVGVGALGIWMLLSCYKEGKIPTLSVMSRSRHFRAS